jgi:hypothetical protein
MGCTWELPIPCPPSVAHLPSTPWSDDERSIQASLAEQLAFSRDTLGRGALCLAAKQARSLRTGAVLLARGPNTPTQRAAAKKALALGVLPSVPTAIVELTDLTDPQRVKMDLPPVRLGDRVKLGFTLHRQHQGRSEILEVHGEFKVTAFLYDQPAGHPIVQVLSTGLSPAWRAVKKQPKKKLGPARYPRAIIVE